MRFGARFAPPAIPPPAGTAWVLRRAFGPLGAAEPGAPPQAVLDLARQLGLSARIGARTARLDLERELGAATALSFAHHAAACAAQAVRLEHGIAEVTAAAAAAGVPIALLKYAALRAGGYLKVGTRWASDVDVLAPESGLMPLAKALESRGWQKAGAAYEHQLPAMAHPAGGTLELHRVMLGVRVASRRRSATFGDLAGLGRLVPHSGGAGESWLPDSNLLAAHAIAHALGQHGFEPGSYPQLRLVADLQDLGFFGEPASLALVERWLARSLPEEEIRGLAELTRALAAGEDPLWTPAGAATNLLAHFLVGTLDAPYRESLKLLRLRFPFSDAPRPRAAVRAARRAFFPARAELSAIYGHPRSRAEAWLQRVARPFDIVRRFSVSLAASRRGHLRAGERPALRTPLEWARLAGSALAVVCASLRVAWQLRGRTVLQAAPRLRHGRLLPKGLRQPRRLAAVADRLLWALPPWSLGPCLKRSLVLLEVWSRCGVETRLHLGLRREAEGSWEGHAWLSTAGSAPPDSGYAEMAVV